MTKVIVKIENAYEDGHESEREVEIDFNNAVFSVFSEDDIEEWFDNVVWDYTGDGHGVDGMGSCYTATVVKCEELPELAGKTYEWVG